MTEKELNAFPVWVAELTPIHKLLGDALVSGKYQGARIRDSGLFEVKRDPLVGHTTSMPDGSRTLGPPSAKVWISFHSDIAEVVTPRCPSEAVAAAHARRAH